MLGYVAIEQASTSSRLLLRARGFSSVSKSVSSAPKKVVFSGIQPTGVPHLGNYLGALQQWKKLQDEAEPGTSLLYSVVDLHAITIRQDAADLKRRKRELLASLLAIGLDPQKAIVFNQSDVPAHSELMWILSCNASVGYLSRMTQWKSKLSLPENASPLDPTTKSPLKLGLFSYPVLQAADVLVHGTTHVPVGADQAQHLEFARECAESFNHHYASVLKIPETIISPAKRVMSLTDPLKKMSKSDTDVKSRILLTDPEETIRKKIKAALTDSVQGISYTPATRPSVSNLVDILFHVSGSAYTSPEDVANDCKELSMRVFKEKVATAVNDRLRNVRERYEEIYAGGTGRQLDVVATQGAEAARAHAAPVIQAVREAVGL